MRQNVTERLAATTQTPPNKKQKRKQLKICLPTAYRIQETFKCFFSVFCFWLCEIAVSFVFLRAATIILQLNAKLTRRPAHSCICRLTLSYKKEGKYVCIFKCKRKKKPKKKYLKKTPAIAGRQAGNSVACLLPSQYNCHLFVQRDMENLSEKQISYKRLPHVLLFLLSFSIKKKKWYSCVQICTCVCVFVCVFTFTSTYAHRKQFNVFKWNKYTHAYIFAIMLIGSTRLSNRPTKASFR